MVQLLSLLGTLPLLSLASAGLLSRQTAATQVVRLTSVENLAVRPNGQILTTNMNSPNLTLVNPVTKQSSVALTVSGARGLSGIAEITPDVFAVIGGKGIYKVDFTAATPTATLIKTITEATNLNGLSAFSNDTVLVADAGKGNVLRLNVNTGDYSIAAADPTMNPSGAIGFGIDGIRYRDGVLWYTNIFRNSMHRISLDATAKSTGAVTTLWTNLMGDDLCFGPNGKLYITTNGRNSVVEVDPATWTAGSTPKVVATVQGSTACSFGRTEADKNVMYVSAGQGVFSVQVT